jgi:glycosyltransferase involved in cell wall biosynthesis
MPALFQRALAYLNTSSLEGFPNAMLQAAASRVPIVSLEVGEAFLRESQSGIFAAGDIERTAAVLQGWANDRSEQVRYGENGRVFVEQHHAVGPVTGQLERALERLVGERA